MMLCTFFVDALVLGVSELEGRGQLAIYYEQRPRNVVGNLR